ncbi:MAG: hypothetical protein J1F24_00170 [Oscillospiraceae bacterium]|nr:hypothetical protein [Oscillospiraceae bacterium]
MCYNNLEYQSAELIAAHNVPCSLMRAFKNIVTSKCSALQNDAFASTQTAFA